MSALGWPLSALSLAVMAVGGNLKLMLYLKFMAQSVYHLKSVASHDVSVAALRGGDYITK